MKRSKTDGMLCLRDDLPLTKIMLCFLFVVFNNIASLNTFGSVLTPNEEESLQNVQTCRIMFRLSLFTVLIQTSHPTTDLWLEERDCGAFFKCISQNHPNSKGNFLSSATPLQEQQGLWVCTCATEWFAKKPAYCLFSLLCLKIKIIYSRHAWPVSARGP